MDKMIENEKGMRAVFHEYFGNALERVAYERAVGFDEWVKAHGDEGKEFLECYEAQYWGADELAECTLPVTRTSYTLKRIEMYGDYRFVVFRGHDPNDPNPIAVL